MPPDERTRDAAALLDILHSAKQAIAHASGLSFEGFAADVLRQDAVIRRIEVVGEAARRVSAAGRASNPELPWVQMVRMRNRIIHEYDQVDLQIVWDTVTKDLPPLVRKLERFVPAGPEQDGGAPSE
jgi:uncharacterized protein with HEPN domain